MHSRPVEEELACNVSVQPPIVQLPTGAERVVHFESSGLSTSLEPMAMTPTIIDPDKKGVPSMTAAELRNSYMGKVPSKHTVDMLIENIAAKENHVRTRSRWIAFLMIAVLGMAALAATMGVSTYAIVENSKESHVRGSIMEDLDGNAVATSTLFSYASLFDLPRFDSRTLAHVKFITLFLEQGFEVTLSVTGAMKQQDSRAVIFLTSSGSKVTVDAGTMIATAEIDGKTRIVKGMLEQSRLLGESRAKIPQLYSEAEFFSEAYDSVTQAKATTDQRRLSNTAGQHGWALVALQAGRAILDTFGNESHDSVHMIGELEVLSGPGQGTRLHEEIYYERNGTGHKVKITQADGSSQLTDFVERAIFRFGSDGTLIECKTPTHFPSRDDVVHLGESVVSQHGTLIQGEADGSTWLLQVVTKNFDATSSSIPTPTLAQCTELLQNNRQHGQRLLGQRKRRLRSKELDSKFRRLTTGELAPGLLWELAYPGSYKSRGVDHVGGGWRIHEAIEVQNAHAVFMTDGTSWVLGVAGTTPSELEDVSHDFDTATACQNDPSGREMCFHKGFLDHANLLIDSLNQKKLELEAAGIQLDYIIGHSLGGAAALIYTQVGMLGLPPKFGVVTFGAPKTRADGPTDTCEAESYPTVRYSHIQDPVGSSAFTWLDGLPSWLGGSLNFNDFEHDASDAIKLEEVCVKWCWSIFWGVYEKRMSTYGHCHDETGFGNLNSAFGALTHLAYGEYLTSDIIDDYCIDSSLPGCGHTI